MRFSRLNLNTRLLVLVGLMMAQLILLAGWMWLGSQAGSAGATGLAESRQALTPPIPFSPYGRVTIGGDPVAGGTLISGWCDGVQYAQGPTEIFDGEAWYSLDLPGDDPETGGKQGCYVGETVIFKIGEIEAVPTATWAAGQAPEITLSDPLPAVKVEKYTLGQDADVAPGVSVEVSSTVTWTYVISNVGNVALSDLSLMDDNGTQGDADDDFLVCQVASLPLGDSKTCTWSDLAREGPYANTATVTAHYKGQMVSDSDPSHYYTKGSDSYLYLPLIIK